MDCEVGLGAVGVVFGAIGVVGYAEFVSAEVSSEDY
jgi:hypothetical protein